MSDEAARTSDYPTLVSTDEVVIRMRHNEPDAYVHIESRGQPTTIEVKSFNVIDSRNGELVGPGLDETPLSSTTLSIPAYGANKFVLRDAVLAPATQFNKVTTLHVVSGEVSATIISPTEFDDYIRQPARTPIST